MLLDKVKLETVLSALEFAGPVELAEVFTIKSAPFRAIILASSG